MSNETTDTPRTDAICIELPATNFDCDCWSQVIAIADFARQLERELAAEIANRKKCCRDGNQISDELFDAQQKLKKADAEVARLNHQLLKTESDLLQSQDLNAWIDSEYRIACKRAENAEAEVEHIKGLLKDIPAVHINTLRGNIAKLSWDSYEHIIGPHPCRERAEKAEAEVDRLTNALDQMTRDALATAKDRDEWMTFSVRSLVAASKEGK